MRIDIISAVPSLLESPFNDSILKRAKEKKIVEINIHNLRDYSTNKQKSIDDYTFGGGAGMVLSIEPVYNCINKLQEKISYDEIIFMTPDGENLNQHNSNQLSLKKIQSGVHYFPNHHLSFFKSSASEQLLKTDISYEKLITLPLHPDLSLEDVDYVSFHLLEILN